MQRSSSVALNIFDSRRGGGFFPAGTVESKDDHTLGLRKWYCCRYRVVQALQKFDNRGMWGNRVFLWPTGAWLQQVQEMLEDVVISSSARKEAQHSSQWQSRRNILGRITIAVNSHLNACTIQIASQW